MIAISGWLQLIYLRLPREVRTQLDDCGLAEVLAVSLDFLVSGSVVEEMLANNVAVHHIKDWLSVRILRECSSPCCFADLKFLSVQPGLPELDSTADVCIATEPVWSSARKTARAFSIEQSDGEVLAQVWLAFIATANSDSHLLASLDELLGRRNRSHAADVKAVKIRRVDWSVAQTGPRGWMRMTQILHDVVIPKGKLDPRVQLLAPRAFCPLPPWMKRLTDIGRSIYGHEIRTVAEIFNHDAVFAVPLWRVWGKELRLSVAALFSVDADRIQGTFRSDEMKRAVVMRFFTSDEFRGALQAIDPSMGTHQEVSSAAVSVVMSEWARGLLDTIPASVLMCAIFAYAWSFVNAEKPRWDFVQRVVVKYSGPTDLSSDRAVLAKLMTACANHAPHRAVPPFPVE